MDRWVDKVAIVTGASSGIGEAIVKILIKNGVKVVGLARRLEKMEKLKSELENESGTFFPIHCDVSKEEDILTAFRWTEEQLGGVDILINNAGIGYFGLMTESSTECYKKITDVNVIAPAICIREAVKIMRDKNIFGHIININSTAGKVCLPRMFLNIYGPSKFALTAMTQVIDSELEHIESPIKITSLHPGLVKTPLVPQELLEKYPFLDTEDIAKGVIYALSTPPHVQVKDLTLTPVPFARGKETQH